MKRCRILIIIAAVLCCQFAYATIIHIPGDYPTIQQGINASANRDTVLVQPGTYYEHINFNGRNIVLGSLFLTTGDTSYISQTIIDGNAAGVVVSIEHGETSETVLTGFTITNGSENWGGGILIDESSPTICHNLITNNNSTHAAGILIIYVTSDIPVIRNNVISNNHAGHIGGGIFCYSSPAIIYDNIISNNSASMYGGGVIIRITDVVFHNNIVVGNNAITEVGGGIYFDRAQSLIVNCTIVNNHAAISGGGVYAYVGSPTISNSILSNNVAPDGSNIDYNHNWDPPDILYSCISDTLWEGPGNIQVDPLFRDPANGDFHLMATYCNDPLDSPCIDAGDPSILDIVLDCDWGLGTTISDMGAYGGGDSTMLVIEDIEPTLPEKLSLLQNYPNPFNAATTIRFSLPNKSEISLSIYNLLGQRVETLFEGIQTSGEHALTWDASRLPSGIYFARLETRCRTENVKMVLLK
jgi:hypothetical protein